MTKDRVNDFLKKYKMDYAGIDMEKSCDLFLSDMEKGLAGQKSSLKMIPTYISMDKDIPVGEKVIVMDAGGTNFRVATVYFDSDKKPVIEDFQKYPMPGTEGEIGTDEFFDTICRYLGPVLEKSNKIGFCFSYPTEILPNKDGKLISFCKEVRVRGAEGMLVGKSLLDALKNKGHTEDKSIVLLNDTVATLLGGRAAYPDRVFDSYIGFILGTGTNTCYVEANKNIKKSPEISASQGAMLINIESGAYDKAERGIIDAEFDKSTVNPDRYKFEKMISGGYQGGLMLTVFKKAAADDLFGGKFTEGIRKISELSSKAIDDFLYYPFGDNALARICDRNDRLVLYYLIDAMLERAAKLVAVNISAVVMKTGKGTDPSMPVCVAAEGTTFYKSKLLRGKLDYYIRTFLNDKKGTYCEFVQADSATLIGTAIAALLN
ncbi:MAG: Hexokinase [Firmicutes bacterium ADurb.Bin193]|nr:MAG: Hexokinase [Firmicutes bacterium ADurb.Bin193]